MNFNYNENAQFLILKTADKILHDTDFPLRASHLWRLIREELETEEFIKNDGRARNLPPNIDKEFKKAFNHISGFGKSFFSK